MIQSLRRSIRLAHFCKFRQPNEEPMLPQMISNLDKAALESYFTNHKEILSLESWIFSFERAMELSLKSKSFIKELIQELPNKLQGTDYMYYNIVLNLYGTNNLPFDEWIEQEIISQPFIVELGLKEDTFVWLLENLDHDSPAISLVLKEFKRQYDFYSKKQLAALFEQHKETIKIDKEHKAFLESDQSSRKVLESRANLLRLLEIFISKIPSIDHLRLIEFRLIIESPNLTKKQLISVVEASSRLCFRLPNLNLVDSVSDSLAAKVGKMTFNDSLILLEAFAKINYVNRFVLAAIMKQLDEDFLTKRDLSLEELDWVGKVVFYLAKLGVLRDDIFQTFSVLFKTHVHLLSSEAICLFAFAHTQMVSQKLQDFESKPYLSSNIKQTRKSTWPGPKKI